MKKRSERAAKSLFFKKKKKRDAALLKFEGYMSAHEDSGSSYTST